MYKVDDLTLIKLLMTEAPILPSIPQEFPPKSVTAHIHWYVHRWYAYRHRSCTASAGHG